MESHGAGRSFEDAVEHYRVAAGRDPLGSLLLVPTPFAADRARRELVARGVPVHTAGMATVGRFSRRWFLQHRTDEGLLERTGASLLIRDLLSSDPDACALLSPDRPPSTAVLHGCYRLFSAIATYLLDYPRGLGDLRSDRSEALGRLHRAYRAELTGRRLVDPPSLRQWTAESLVESGARFGTVVLYALEELYPADHLLVDAIVGSADRLIRVASDDELAVQACRTARFADRRRECAAHAAACRALIDAGVPPDEIVVGLVRDGVAPLIEEAFVDQGLACARPPAPLDRSPLGAAVIALLETVASDWSPDALLRLLRSPCIAPGFEPEMVDLLDRVARESHGTGRSDLRVALARRIDRSRTEHDARRLRALDAALEQLGARLDPLLPAQDREGMVRAVRSILGPGEDEGSSSQAEAGAVWAALEGVAATARVLGLPPTTAAGLLAEAVPRLEVAQAPARVPPGAVTVIDLREIAGVPVPHLFLPGLVETALPAAGDRVPFLTEAEATVLGLPPHTGTRDAERRSFARALAGGGTCYLSTPELDGTGPAAPSPFLEEVEALGAGQWAPPTAGAGRREEALRVGRSRGGGVPGRDAAPGMAAVPGEGVPITHLEEYARCPFLWYARRVLRLEPIPDPGEVEDGRARGTRLHALLAGFYRRWAAAGRHGISPDEREQARILALAVAAEVYPSGDPLRPVEAAERAWCTGEGLPYPGLLDRFLDQEVRLHASGFVPGPIEMDVSLPVPGGRTGTRVTGRIDRLDVSDQGTFVVHDYKSAGRLDSLADLGEGRSLQLPLYLAAAERALGLVGVGGCYYQIHRTGVGPQALIWSRRGGEALGTVVERPRGAPAEPGTAAVRALESAAAHLEGMASRNVAPAGSDDDCRYCPYRTICRREAP